MKTKRAVQWFAMAGLVALAGWGFAETTGNVTWTGLGGAPEWNVAGNWDPDAPAVNTPGRLTFSTAGQSVTSVVETARSVNELFAGHSDTTAGCTHTIDLGENVLTVTNCLRVIAGANGMRNTLNLANGTLRIGTAASPAQLDIYSMGTLRLQPGARLDPLNIELLDMPTVWQNVTELDLRGAEIVGGTLSLRELVMATGANLATGRAGARFYLDDETKIDTLQISDSVVLGRYRASSDGSPTYIGNPSDTFTMDSGTFGKFPAGINLRFGISPTQRAGVVIAEHTHHSVNARAAIRVAAGGGGTFVGYMSSLGIGVRSQTTEQPTRRPRGMLHLAEMDSCLLDAVTIEIAPGRGAEALATDDERGELHLPPGTATVSTVTLGAPEGAGFGRLALNGTVFTVTNLFTLNKTADVSIRTGSEPAGLDIDGIFNEAGGIIHVDFTAQPPPETTNWAIRVKGDVATVLNSMIGNNRLTYDIDGGISGKHAGVLTNATHTYFALVDDSVTLAPVAIAQNVTFDIETDGTVLVAPPDVDNGSFNPGGGTTELVLIYNGNSETNVLAFTEVGDYPVTLKINVLENGSVTASATDTATVHVVPLHPGTQTNVEWTGNAGSTLMPRREWLWAGNWAGGMPPANPTAATVFFSTLGQNVTSVLEADRTVAALHAGHSTTLMSCTHTLDLGGQTLTVTNRLRTVAGSADLLNTLNVTNGTLRVGSASGDADIDVLGSGLLRLAPGTHLDPIRIGTVTIFGNWQAVSAIDLRGAHVVGGVLRIRRLTLGVSTEHITQSAVRIYMDSQTAMTALHVLDSLELGVSRHGSPNYIGNPDDTFAWQSQTFGRLPPGIDIVFGDGPTVRAGVTIAEHPHQNNSCLAAIRAAGGGSASGWLSHLRIGTRSGATTGTRRPQGLLHLAAMDACSLDIETLSIAPGRGLDALPTDNERGELHLPPGTVKVGTATIGAPAGIGHGLLSLSNTMFTVTNSLTLNKTAQVLIDVGDTASGIDLTNAEPGALTLDPDAAITVRFRVPPSGRSLHYGLRLSGDHVDALESLQGSGKLIVDSAGLAGQEATIFTAGGKTYVGLALGGGSLFLLR